MVGNGDAIRLLTLARTHFCRGDRMVGNEDAIAYPQTSVINWKILESESENAYHGYCLESKNFRDISLTNYEH